MGSDSRRIFVPRAPRFVLETPVSIELSEGTIKGQSVNVSESGMAAIFEELMDVWAKGPLHAEVGDSHITLNVRVARANGREAGLTFLIAGDDDREAIQKLIDCAIEKGAPPYGDMPPRP
jgi:hypothetical protein